ncbi:Argininosuccinate lyase [Buchnera aphidicola (Tetraneura ulmi)]|uniref:argininosuccinate lyase n=1 Tax=Buchnera aphidicola TaxID=9 RepID=UPI0034640F1D
MALWGGRFSMKPDVFFKKFNSSLEVDYRLAEQDIIASIAWSDAIFSCKIITKDEHDKIQKVLIVLLKKIQKNPKLILTSGEEDVHSWVETELTKQLGVLGKKIHAGRSRNDQVTTDLKLWCKSQIFLLIKSLVNLETVLVSTAEKYISVIMPGFTHLQHAQPITFSYWCLAYLEMFKRDEWRLKDALNRLDFCPLGSGALCGTSWNIDRKSLSNKLGFSEPTDNALDSVSDRDYVMELLSIAAISMIHLSRFSEDLIIFNSSEFGYVELSDLLTSGSSLMPQKKNPDVLELIRGKSARVCASMMRIFFLFKSLPLSYNKDMQEDKEGLFDAFKTWNDSLNMSSMVLKTIELKKNRCFSSAKKGYSNATELADYLVKKGVSFREAHHIIGNIVQESIKQNKLLEELDISVFKKFSSYFGSDLYQVLSLESCLNKRNSHGGVSNNQIKKSILKEKKRLNL